MTHCLLLRVDIWDRYGPPDPYTVAREVIELAQRLKVGIRLRVTPTWEIDINPEYAPPQSDIARSIIDARNQGGV